MTMTTETTTIDPAVTDTDAARAALIKAVRDIAVFEPLEEATDYINALHMMTSDNDLEERFCRPMWRLVGHVADRLTAIEQEVNRVHDLAMAVSRPVEEPAGDVELIALGEQLKAAWAAEREAYARDCSAEEGDVRHKACSEIARQIEQVPATTLKGLQVKAAAIAWCCGGKPFAEQDETTDKRLVTSLLADLQAMQAAA